MEWSRKICESSSQQNDRSFADTEMDPWTINRTLSHQESGSEATSLLEDLGGGITFLMDSLNRGIQDFMIGPHDISNPPHVIRLSVYNLTGVPAEGKETP
mmetsp:Transcript_14612/g.27905  ORF Transcript_14612/g.27905 Transcript_14612/m.27905 type:complete len:100 (-) Transcript_14612:2731-3030(-)